MAIIGSVPRRCVNLPPGSFKTLIRSISGGNRQEAIIEKFYKEFSHWLGASHSLGTSSGRSAFQLALQALGMTKGSEIIFPMFTFPVIPLVAKLLGYQPVFCDVNPKTYNSDPEHIAPKIPVRFWRPIYSAGHVPSAKSQIWHDNEISAFWKIVPMPVASGSTAGK